jgi:flagellin
MGIRINTNVSSLTTQRHLYNSTVSFQKSMEKLASGLRINRAADDAAGLAISEGMKSNIRALGQASRNASDAISLVQTAEGALDEVSNILLRMKELSEQSLGGTLSSDQQGYLNSEFTELKDEITRISDGTEFNGIPLLDGTLDVDVQVGIDTAPTSSINILLGTDMDATGLALDVVDITDATNAAAALTAVDTAIATVSQSRSTFGAKQNRLESSIRNINNQAENLSAANSRIRDVDVANETSKMTSYQILQQAGVSVLAQANMTTGLAMSLLG